MALSLTNVTIKQNILIMKKHILTITTFFFIFTAQTQVTPTVHLDTNNVDVLLTTRGTISHDFYLSAPSYEVPKGSGTHPLFELTPIWSALDQDSVVQCSFQPYNASGNFQGPVSDDYTSSWHMDTRTFFSVPESVATDHMNNWNQSGYTTPQSITEWLGEGMPSEGTDLFIAPFEDADGSQTYNPSNGDYPLVKGDKNYFSVYNYDSLESTNNNSVGSPYPVEVRQMVYQYATNDARNNATYIKYIVVNRGDETLEDFKFGCFVDFDLGNSQDDYIGTDSLRNMFYVYNADNNDETQNTTGYQMNPPAFGIDVLNKNLHATILYSETSIDYNFSYPAAVYYAMNGRNTLNQPQLDANNNEVKLIYKGDPNVSGSESEIGLNNAAGDRKAIFSIEPVDLGPNEYTCYDIVLTYAQGSDHLNSVAELQSASDYIQLIYDTEPNDCWTPPAYSGIQQQETTEASIHLYPNPFEESLTITTPEAIDHISVLDINGKLIQDVQNPKPTTTLSTATLTPGLYFVKITLHNGVIQTRKVIKK